MIYLNSLKSRVKMPEYFSGAPGGTRIMDLDQYLEKMNTNTNVIWIQETTGILLLKVARYKSTDTISS